MANSTWEIRHFTQFFKLYYKQASNMLEIFTCLQGASLHAHARMTDGGTPCHQAVIIIQPGVQDCPTSFLSFIMVLGGKYCHHMGLLVLKWQNIFKSWICQMNIQYTYLGRFSPLFFLLRDHYEQVVCFILTSCKNSC